MTVHHEKPFPEGLKHLSPEYKTFFDLVRPKEKKKSRICLRCQTNTVTGTKGERICADCYSNNRRVGVLGTYVVPSPLNERDT